MFSEIDRLRALAATCLTAARSTFSLADAVRLREIAKEALARAASLETAAQPQGQQQQQPQPAAPRDDDDQPQ